MFRIFLPAPLPTPAPAVPVPSSALTPVRGIVDNHFGGLKTVSSTAAVPPSQEVTDTLARWHALTLYPEPTDWVFPSPKMGGKQRYWQDSLMRKVVWPAAKRAGWEYL
jgi:hypothetical protein